MELSNLGPAARQHHSAASRAEDADPGMPDVQSAPQNTYPRPQSPVLSASADDVYAGESLLPQPPRLALPRSLTVRLYTSHFLSTWNSRLFEFGAALFLADIFPSSLLPLSVYALVRSSAVVLGAQLVGNLVDQAAKSVDKRGRLEVVRASILGGRTAVAGSCALLLLLRKLKSDTAGADEPLGGTLNGGASVLGLFVALIPLACVEKLCATMNLVAVERDWVVAMTDDNDVARRSLNARMRRIDLLCKLLGPLAVASTAAASIDVAIWTTLGTNIVSIAPEYICVAQVYKKVPSLHGSSPGLVGRGSTEEGPRSSVRDIVTRHILPLKSLPYYLHHRAFLPSFALCLLYLTVLSLSGQMVTYLLSTGYTSLHVGLIRFASTVFELSATWVAPRLMQRIGAVRSGIWSLSWQMTWLAAGASWFFSGIHGHGTNSVTAAAGLVVGVTLSRVGLWSYDLCAQSIIQEEVEGDHRGSFSAVEAAFQNLFELASYATTIVFSRPDEFQWPVAISIAAVYVAGGLYASFVHQRRGHLFHRPVCSCLEKGGAGRGDIGYT